MKRNVWIKASDSGSNGGCYEFRFDGETIELRDSKDPDGPVLKFNTHEHQTMIGAAKRGEFDI